MYQSLLLPVQERDGDPHCSAEPCPGGNTLPLLQLRRKEVGRSTPVSGTCVVTLL